MTLTARLTRLADTSRRLAVTETIYRELGNLWGAGGSVVVHIRGVDHDLIHAIAEIRGEPARRGYWRQGASAGVIYVRTGGDDSPRLFGQANLACIPCLQITGADAPATLGGAP